MNAKQVNLLFALVSSGLLLAALLLVLALHSPIARAEPSAPSDSITGRLSKSVAPGTSLRSDASKSASPDALITVVLSPSSAAPTVQPRPIVAGIDPVLNSQFGRSGVSSACSQDYACPGTQSQSGMPSCQASNCIDPSPDWQCVRETPGTRGCGQQVYSPTYQSPVIRIPTETASPTLTPAPTAAFLPTATAAPAETVLPTITPAPTETPLPTATAAPAESVLPTITPAPTETPLPTATAAPAESVPPTMPPVPTGTPPPTATAAQVVPGDPPSVTSLGSKWIDVDLSEQRLVAYEGGTPVLSALVSTGVARTPTPIGEFKIIRKVRIQPMIGPGYYVPNVEYVSYFYSSYAIHGTYWHNNFGHPMSHGCINMTNPDAKWIYEWAPLGTPVRIHH